MFSIFILILFIQLLIIFPLQFFAFWGSMNFYESSTTTENAAETKSYQLFTASFSTFLFTLSESILIFWYFCLLKASMNLTKFWCWWYYSGFRPWLLTTINADRLLRKCWISSSLISIFTLSFFNFLFYSIYISLYAFFVRVLISSIYLYIYHDIYNWLFSLQYFA